MSVLVVIVWYLYIGAWVQSDQGGHAVTTISDPYETKEDCEEAMKDVPAEITAQAKDEGVKATSRASCTPVDFGDVSKDPISGKHIPQQDEVDGVIEAKK